MYLHVCLLKKTLSSTREETVSYIYLVSINVHGIDIWMNKFIPQLINFSADTHSFCLTVLCLWEDQFFGILYDLTLLPSRPESDSTKHGFLILDSHSLVSKWPPKFCGFFHPHISLKHLFLSFIATSLAPLIHFPHYC